MRRPVVASPAALEHIVDVETGYVRHVRSCQVAGEDGTARHDILKVRGADLQAMDPTMRWHGWSSGDRNPVVEECRAHAAAEGDADAARRGSRDALAPFADCESVFVVHEGDTASQMRQSRMQTNG